MNETEDESVDGCPECKLAYSFFFNTQFHKEGCSLGFKEVKGAEEALFFKNY
jgi:hypothetical protein